MSKKSMPPETICFTIWANLSPFPRYTFKVRIVQFANEPHQLLAKKSRTRACGTWCHFSWMALSKWRKRRKGAGNEMLGIVAAVGLTKLNVFVLTTNTEYKLKNALKRNNQFTSWHNFHFSRNQAKSSHANAQKELVGGGGGWVVSGRAQSKATHNSHHKTRNNKPKNNTKTSPQGHQKLAASHFLECF